jgi:hypothetical protein
MLLNLEVNITAGSLTSCPGRCSWTPASRLLVRPEHGGRRRAVDALDGHRFFFVVVVVARRWCRAATLHCSPL